MPHPIQQHYRANYYPRQLQYRNLVPRLRHPRQTRGAAFERGAECGEGVGLSIIR
jgi:hypothetical protein